jgi:MarR family transcriptional regulator, organic hydroperoxide resistance regulator
MVDNLIARNIKLRMTAETDDVLRLDRQICFRLYAASNLLTRLYRPVLRELGLTYPQYLVMLTLWEGAPQSVGDIGERLYLDSGTLTPLLKRLEAAGLVSRERDATDERRVLVTLTKAGRALKLQAKKVPATLARGLNLQPSQVIELRRTVDDMIGVLLSSVHD